jgi:hypothetical protein
MDSQPLGVRGHPLDAAKLPILTLKVTKSGARSVTCWGSVGGMGIPFWRGFVDIGKEELDRGQYDYGNFVPFTFCGGAALLKRDTFLKAGRFDES